MSELYVKEEQYQGFGFFFQPFCYPLSKTRQKKSLPSSKGHFESSEKGHFLVQEKAFSPVSETKEKLTRQTRHLNHFLPPLFFCSFCLSFFLLFFSFYWAYVPTQICACLGAALPCLLTFRSLGPDFLRLRTMS